MKYVGLVIGLVMLGVAIYLLLSLMFYKPFYPDFPPLDELNKNYDEIFSKLNGNLTSVNIIGD